jgi:outer membrane receptor protein involved in Fe transport
MRYLFSILISISFLSNINSQEREKLITGAVQYKDEYNHREGLEFVNVYWEKSKYGVVSDSKGNFKIRRPNPEDGNKLVISYIGYKSDTLEITGQIPDLNILLKPDNELEEVTLTKRRGGLYNMKLSTMPVQVTTEAGLQKLACCNIGESFENSATVDVGYTDAVSGARIIRMLGLDGKYSQFLFENIPYLRGMESGYGLSHIPGPFMESIQVSKGTASITNGYESTTGQINVEYKKPDASDLFYANLYANSEGRFESNMTSALSLNERWSTMVLFHGSSNQVSLDMNDDGFYDLPLSRQLNFMNRWEYKNAEKVHIQFGFEAMKEKRIGGQTGYTGKEEELSSLYGTDIELAKYRAFGKIGFTTPSKPYQSFGWINSFTWFDQNSLFGLRNYDGSQKNLFSNFIWQTIIGNTNHMISSGITFQYDSYDETFMDSNFIRNEIIPGIFSQYTYSLHEKMVLMTGLRLDHNSVYGLLFTPRIHVKYNLTEDLVARGTLGRAFRSANVFAENLNLMSSSRQFQLEDDFRIEEAWNTGLSLTRNFHLKDEREASLTFDIYHTEFNNQIVVDVDHDVNAAWFYNLTGRSYSTSFQTEINAEPLRGLELIMAYRFNDVKTDQLDGNFEKPYIVRNKGLFSISYATRFEKWKIDLNLQYNGHARIPSTEDNPVEYQRETKSPDYFIMHTQLTKRWKLIDLYAGIENLTDFTQKDPIIAADDPFGSHFDASMIWGPITGRTYYAGIRFRIK